MEKNLFKGAKFGDKYVTRDGYVLRYIHGNFKDTNAPHLLFNEITGYTYRYQNNGCRDLKKEIYANCDDIVSRYYEPIDEEKLDERAKEDTSKIISTVCLKTGVTPYDYNKINVDDWEDILIDAYKAGYRKAKEE